MARRRTSRRVVFMAAETTRPAGWFRPRDRWPAGSAGAAVERVDPRRMGGLPGVDLGVLARAGSPSSSVPARSIRLANGSIVERRSSSPSGQEDHLGSARSTVSSASGSAAIIVEQLARASRPIHDDRQHAVLQAVVPEDVGERGREDRPDAPGAERPRRVLARRARPRSCRRRAGSCRPAISGWSSTNGGVLERAVLLEAPVAEERVGQAGLVGHLQVAGRDDLVGVDVLGRRAGTTRLVNVRNGSAIVSDPRPRRAPRCRAACADRRRRRRSPRRPRSAARPGTSGRPCPGGPRSCGCCVLTAYWPGDSWSPFIAMHIEQPASRHSRAGGPEDLVPGPRARPRASPRRSRARP